MAAEPEAENATGISKDSNAELLATAVEVRAQVYFATAARLHERFADLRSAKSTGSRSGNQRLSRDEVLELAGDVGFAFETEGQMELAFAAMEADENGTVDMFDFEDWWKRKW